MIQHIYSPQNSFVYVKQFKKVLAIQVGYKMKRDVVDKIGKYQAFYEAHKLPLKCPL